MGVNADVGIEICCLWKEMIVLCNVGGQRIQDPAVPRLHIL